MNRSLKSDVQMFFRHPKELLNQYMRNMKSVLEFQTFHRSHLQKHFNSKVFKIKKIINFFKCNFINYFNKNLD